jgi:hypothetical protein
MRKALFIAVAWLCLLTPAVASAKTQIASAGNVRAALSWRGQSQQVKDMHLTISQAGKVVYDQPVTAADCMGRCGPGAPTGKSVRVLDLDGNGGLEVVVDLYSQGAHCCFIDQVFSPSAALGTWVVTQRDFQNSGAALKDLNRNGQTEFVSADNAFAYAFTDFAQSGLPIQIFRFSMLSFVNVTRRYPALIRKDAHLWWGAYLSDHDSGRVGLIAAWTADEYNLGRRASADKTLAKQVSEHRISARFVKQLNAFLKRNGYTR